MPATYTHHYALRNKANNRYFVAVPQNGEHETGDPTTVVYTYEDSVDATIPFCEPPTMFATSELATEVAGQIMKAEPNLQVEVVFVTCIMK